MVNLASHNTENSPLNHSKQLRNSHTICHKVTICHLPIVLLFFLNGKKLVSYRDVS